MERISKCVKNFIQNYETIIWSLLIVSNQSTKVFPPDFFQNKKDSVINKKNQKNQSNSSSLKEKKHEDHHDLDDDSEILHLIKGKGNF